MYLRIRKIAMLILFVATGTLAMAQSNISIVNIEVNKENGVPNGAYSVRFFNSDNDGLLLGQTPSYTVATWYLSYKGKRVSDYYTTSVGYGRVYATALAWPDEIPKGNERYVTAQLGKEPAKKDRRDDD